MDDLYKGDESSAMGPVDQTDEQAAHVHELEIQTILQQAMGNDKKRSYFKADSQSQTPFRLEIRRIYNADLGCQIILNPIVAQSQLSGFCISTFTVNDLKRTIVQDPFHAGQLNLVYQVGPTLGVRPFQIGIIERETLEFVPFGVTETLSETQIEDGDIVYVKVLDDNNVTGGGGSSGGNSLDPDSLLRNRMNRLTLRQ
jgi:hypothetical protein